MRSLGFGLDRIAHLALASPRISALILAVLVVLMTVGLTRLSFDDDLRNGFAGSSQAFADYSRTTDEFVDPENELLLLVEGRQIADPLVLARLQTLQLELQLIDDVASVTSIFSLRSTPDENGNSTLVIEDPSAGLPAPLRERIRAHPLLGNKLLSAAGDALVYVITPADAKSSTATSRALITEIRAAAASGLAGTGLAVTVTGFPAIRADVADILIWDQIRMNAAAAVIGAIMSLIVFQSVVAAVLTLAPAVLASGLVLGATGLLGIPLTLMSNLVPTLIVILAFADAMHLSNAWRAHRNAGASPEEAERLALAEVGPACMLTAITTALAFLSLTVSDVSMVQGFGWLGALGTLAGGIVALFSHALLAPVLGRHWRAGAAARPNLLVRSGGASAALCRFAIAHARSISVVAMVAFVGLAAMHAAVPAQQSVQEHLPRDNPANAALGRIDVGFGGAYAVEIVVPLDGLSPTSPAALTRIADVHRAVASVDGAGTPLSLASLVAWLGADPSDAGPRLADLLDTLSPADRSRFVGASGAALVMLTLHEASTAETERIVDQIEAAARAAGGRDVTVTGIAVLTARESIRTINSLRFSLTLAVIAGLGAMMIAFRNWRIGVVAFLPNVLPVVATGGLLFLSGRGMQFTSVLSLTVAFGIAVDDTIHYLNRFMMAPGTGPLDERLIEASRRVGPVLVGTTVIIIAGMATTLTSGLPTVVLFGQLVSLTLVVALVGDLVVLPALMAGPLRRWFGASSV